MGGEQDGAAAPSEWVWQRLSALKSTLSGMKAHYNPDIRSSPKSCSFILCMHKKGQTSCFCSLLLLFNKLHLIWFLKKRINWFFFYLATAKQKCNILAKRAVPETNWALAYSANSSGGFQPFLTVKKKRLWLIQHDSLSVSCCETEPRKAANHPSF